MSAWNPRIVPVGLLVMVSAYELNITLQGICSIDNFAYQKTLSDYDQIIKNTPGKVDEDVQTIREEPLDK